MAVCVYTSMTHWVDPGDRLSVLGWFAQHKATYRLYVLLLCVCVIWVVNPQLARCYNSVLFSCVHSSTWIYMYIWRERERETCILCCAYIHIYIYVCTHKYTCKPDCPYSVQIYTYGMVYWLCMSNNIKRDVSCSI